MGWRDGVSSIIAFLRAGHPRDAPAFGYAPLLALLPRRISDDEVAIVARTLVVRNRRSIGDADLEADLEADIKADIGVEITRITDAMPTMDDIDRVRHRLDSIGRG